jgi:hypothetical protein
MGDDAVEFGSMGLNGTQSLGVRIGALVPGEPKVLCRLDVCADPGQSKYNVLRDLMLIIQLRKPPREIYWRSYALSETRWPY